MARTTSLRLDVIAKVKETFFDRKAVINAFDKATRSRLSMFGAFVRKGAKTSMRRRKKASAPGTPPSVHIGFLRQLLFYGLDGTQRSVVIGPVKLPRKGIDGTPVHGTVPEVLEKGGSVYTEEYQREFTAAGRRMLIERWGRDPDQWHRIGKKRLWHKGGEPLRIRNRRRRVIDIAPRPYMQPAFEKEKAKAAGVWQDAVKK